VSTEGGDKGAGGPPQFIFSRLALGRELSREARYLRDCDCVRASCDASTRVVHCHTVSSREQVLSIGDIGTLHGHVHVCVLHRVHVASMVASLDAILVLPCMFTARSVLGALGVQIAASFGGRVPLRTKE
jgi:hypothetical protein